MTDVRSRLPRGLALCTLAAAALLAPLAVAAPAAAHSDVVATDPAADTPDQQSVVDQLPDSVSVTFSDDLTPPQRTGDESTTQIRVFDETCEDAGLLIADPGRADVRDCTDYATGDAVVEGPRVTQQVDNAGAPAGIYTVVWQVVYGDGHPFAQMFTFTAENAASPATPTATPTATPADPDETAAPSADPTGDAEPSGDAAAPDDADPGLSTPVVVAIAGGIVVLALVAFIVVMIARSRRS